jgi:hypothetical protein
MRAQSSEPDRSRRKTDAITGLVTGTTVCGDELAPLLSAAAELGFTLDITFTWADVQGGPSGSDR